MIAVTADAGALAYVREQTEELCLAAIRQDYRALALVREVTPRLLEEALRINPDAGDLIA